MKKTLTVCVAVTLLVLLCGGGPSQAAQESGLANSYSHVATVAKNGGDYADPVTAMDDVTAWCGTPSAENRCLLQIKPGEYGISDTLQMREYVDIEGAGRDTTKIVGAVNSPETGVVRGASLAEIRSLTVENTGGGHYSFALYNENTSPSIAGVTAAASGGVANCGIYNNNASPRMNGVFATAEGGKVSYGVRNINASSPEMLKTTAAAKGGTYNYGVFNIGEANPKIAKSSISGSTKAIYTMSRSAKIVVESTRLEGGVTGSASLICSGSYNENDHALDSNCERMAMSALTGSL